MEKVVHFFCRILLIPVLFCTSCEEQVIVPSVTPQYVPRYQWKTSSLESQKIDSVKIDSAVSLLGRNADIFSLILIRNGFLLKEFYQSQLFSYNEFELRSATKSIVSALVGIALQKKLIDSLDQPMISFFPEYNSPNLDPRTRLITVRHLLTMRAGFDFNENDPPPYLGSAADDRVKLIIELPMKYNPGEKFYYGSVQTHLLSAIVAKKSGLSTYDFGKKYLFDPAQFHVGYWSKDPQGIQYGGSGIMMTSRDMARFGSLYLRHGIFDSAAILPHSWVTQTVQPTNLNNSIWGDFTARNYGFSWWTNNNGKDSIYFAAGSGGQFIIVVPPKNAVIVTTANPNLSSEIINRQEEEIIEIISRYILPSLK